MVSDRTNVRDTSNATPSSPETFRNQAHETTAELQDRSRETRDQVRERAEELSAQAREVAAEYYQQGREKAAEWERVLEDQIREKPLQSLLVAGGIGLLLGLLWRR